MNKVIWVIVFLQIVCKVSAQDLTISFQAQVSGTPIDSVQATNLRTSQFVKLLGGESLVLAKNPTGINLLSEINETGYIYPNPTDGDATLCFSTNKTQEVEIRLYNASGQLLNQNRWHLEQGIHRFELKFPVAGIYYLSVQKSDGLASFKAVYAGSEIQTSSIQYAGNEKLNSQNINPNQLKSATTDKSLAYSDGDFIQYSVFSGVNTTIVTDSPIVSKTIDVEFVNCIDKDNKSYKVVKIGDQLWMAENLAWLPSVSPSSASSEIAPYYFVSDYMGTSIIEAKSTSNFATYGVLYNWEAAKTACPAGWHLPTDEEWKQLEMALGMTKAEADTEGSSRGTNQGIQLKNTSGWAHNAYNGNGTNTSGFSALPGGYRYLDGNFASLGVSGYWWSATEYSATYAWYRNLYYTIATVGRSSTNKTYGYSVRCVRD
jgi:uncharacterized protein (TIGR02145 family)